MLNVTLVILNSLSNSRLLIAYGVVDIDAKQTLFKTAAPLKYFRGVTINCRAVSKSFFRSLIAMFAAHYFQQSYTCLNFEIMIGAIAHSHIHRAIMTHHAFSHHFTHGHVRKHVEIHLQLITCFLCCGIAIDSGNFFQGFGLSYI